MANEQTFNLIRRGKLSPDQKGIIKTKVKNNRLSLSLNQDSYAKRINEYFLKEHTFKAGITKGNVYDLESDNGIRKLGQKKYDIIFLYALYTDIIRYNDIVEFNPNVTGIIYDTIAILNLPLPHNRLKKIKPKIQAKIKLSNWHESIFISLSLSNFYPNTDNLYYKFEKISYYNALVTSPQNKKLNSWGFGVAENQDSTSFRCFVFNLPEDNLISFVISPTTPVPQDVISADDKNLKENIANTTINMYTDNMKRVIINATLSPEDEKKFEKLIKGFQPLPPHEGVMTDGRRLFEAFYNPKGYEIIPDLIRKGADVNYAVTTKRSSEYASMAGWTTLHAACDMLEYEAIELILKTRKCDIWARNENGQIAFDLIFTHEREQITDLVKEYYPSQYRKMCKYLGVKPDNMIAKLKQTYRYNFN